MTTFLPRADLGKRRCASSSTPKAGRSHWSVGYLVGFTGETWIGLCRCSYEKSRQRSRRGRHIEETAVGILSKLLISAKETIGENMYYFWSGLLGTIALLWSVLGLRMLRGMAGVPRLAGVMPLPDGECLPISILFAARDEAAKLPQALPTQLAQDYPRYEVIAVDDRSRDATPQILDEFAGHHKNLKVIHLTELPTGW